MAEQITHLAVSANQFRPQALPKPDFLSCREVAPDFDVFFALLRLVGGKDGWHQRPEFEPNVLEQTIKIIEDPASRLWIFKAYNRPVGMCMAARFESQLFRFGLPDDNTAEIYKIGLYPEHTGKRWGRHLLSQVALALLTSNEFLYLNTRKSNRVNAVPFYNAFGMKVIG